jgi:hypothetical protein
LKTIAGALRCPSLRAGSLEMAVISRLHGPRHASVYEVIPTSVYEAHPPTRTNEPRNPSGYFHQFHLAVATPVQHKQVPGDVAEDQQIAIAEFRLFDSFLHGHGA